MEPLSQLAPLPKELPFRLVSQTIGRGAYASIRKAVSLDRRSPVFAVKFIHKEYATKNGRVTAKQIAMEVALHSHIGQHQNIIQFYDSGEDHVWRWIAMDFAEGGDLFDKIEADAGVSEDVAHFYFTQMVSAISYMHSRGVAHRDIKPENILLAASGDLKIADFGLANLFNYNGKKKLATTVCGSPPYIAPEVISSVPPVTSKGVVRGSGYEPDKTDIWSCGVVLFVLLVGNTPWDEPTTRSWEFEEYIRTEGRSTDELWQKVPHDAISLLRGMMRVDSKNRFTFEDIRRHPWFTRPNPYLSADGRLSSPVTLATQLLESLRIDFNQDPISSQMSTDPMDIDDDVRGRFASTQPVTPINDVLFDWERPARVLAVEGVSASQPAAFGSKNGHSDLWDHLAEDPTMSQFSATPAVPVSLTQRARNFRDIIPAQGLTRFFSHLEISLLLQMMSEAFHRLGVPIPPPTPNTRNDTASIKVKTVDTRSCPLSGDIVIDRTDLTGDGGLLEVRFVKVMGDPVEWRRFFKKIVVLCKDGVYVPNG